MRALTSFCALLCVCGFLGCDSSKPTPTSTTPEPSVPKKVEVTPSDKLVMAGAEHWVSHATERAFSEAILRARSQLVRAEEEEASQPPAELAARAARLTFVFSANNHGEREDCGCKRNPLGGLGRRATLIDMANLTDEDETAARYWEAKLERDGSLIVLDAGDALFKSTTLKSAPEKSREQALRHAEAVVEAMNLRPPDVMNVGEYDLSLGVEVLEKLAKRAKFPMISANLRKKGEQKLLFPAHLVVEKAGGQKIAFIGLTKQRARVLDYYKQQGVEVDEAKAAYKREVAALPEDVDVVVMLNNEGVPATQALIKELEAEGVRVDMAFVSNSNLMTKKPRWTMGVPVLEPMSRGKHLGRVDVWRKGDEPLAFMNNTPSTILKLDQYRRAWQKYLQAIKQRDQLRERLARYGVIMELGEVPAEKATGKKDDKPLTPDQLQARKDRAKKDLERDQKRLDALNKRVELTSKEARKLAAELDRDEATVASRGDDWIEVHVVPVLLEIPEEPSTRRVLDRYKD